MENKSPKSPPPKETNNITKNDSQSSPDKNNSTEQSQSHRHSTLNKAILTFRLENTIIKLPHLTSFIVDLQIDDSKLIFSPKATEKENNFFIGYKTQKIVTARINNSHTRAKARKIHLSISVFNKDKRKISTGQIDINPSSFYGEEKLKLRPLSIDLGKIEPSPLFFFGLQLNDIPSDPDNDENNSETNLNQNDNINKLQLPQLQNFELPDTLISTSRRTAHRDSDIDLMTEAELEGQKIDQTDQTQNDETKEEEENDDEFFIINNPELIEMIEKEKKREEEEKERKKQEEEMKIQEEKERKRQEEEKKRQDEIRRKKQEEEKKKRDELKRKFEEDKKNKLEDLMQRSSSTKSTKNKLKNKKILVNSLSKNANILKNAIKIITSHHNPSKQTNFNFIPLNKKIKRSFSTNPKKVTLPPLFCPLKITFNFAFCYSYRFPTDQNGKENENAPFDPQKVVLNDLNVNKNWKKFAFKSVGVKSKSTDEVTNYKKENETRKICSQILNDLDNSKKLDKNNGYSENEVKNSIIKLITDSNSHQNTNNCNLHHFTANSQITAKNNNKKENSKSDTNENNSHFNKAELNINSSLKDMLISKSGKIGANFISDSLVNNSYNSYRNDAKRQAMILLSAGDDGESRADSSSSIVQLNDFIIDEICAKQGDVDNDEFGNFRTRYESLQRQSKIRFILMKIRRYNSQNRPKKLETENMIFYEWTEQVASDDDYLYEYYEYD